MILGESLAYAPVELGFGTSGLRGLVSDMTDLECYINARGFLEYLKLKDGLSDGGLIHLAGDLRDSTPRILQVMVEAVNDAGMLPVNCGKIPTPAAAYYALDNDAPCIVVTGSHIPADRNGIKFYKSTGEVLKDDEDYIRSAIAEIRQEVYGKDAEASKFDPMGRLKEMPIAPDIDLRAETEYKLRYTNFFAGDSLAGKKIVVYQHSAVGRDIIVEILEALGAMVVPVGRSETFMPIDTENIRGEEERLFKQFIAQNPGAFAVVSTDGDSDRPFVIDETGTFHRGDVLGCIGAEFLGARFAVVPISSNDAVDEFCAQKGMKIAHTKIGSPYVISTMQESSVEPAVGWEVNGGLLLGSDIQAGTRVLRALPTRDAVLPILCALVAAVESNKKVSEIFAALPKRYTGGGLIDVTEQQATKIRSLGQDMVQTQQIADRAFSSSPLGSARLNATDGLRMIFNNGDVIHLRASGNAPQIRVYTNASTQDHANVLVEQALAPDGYIPKLLSATTEQAKAGRAANH